VGVGKTRQKHREKTAEQLQICIEDDQQGNRQHKTHAQEREKEEK